MSGCSDPHRSQFFWSVPAAIPEAQVAAAALHSFVAQGHGRRALLERGASSPLGTAVVYIHGAFDLSLPSGRTERGGVDLYSGRGKDKDGVLLRSSCVGVVCLSDDNGVDILRLHLVLGDEKGDAIHAVIPKGLIFKFQKLILEGHVYYLQYLEVSPVMKPYRTTYHRFELRFTAWVTVMRVDHVTDAFPLYAYRLRSLNDISETVTDKTYLADVMLLVNGVSEIMEISVKGKPTAKRNLRLADGRHTAIMILWGSNAEMINADDLIRRSRTEPVIVLAMGLAWRRGRRPFSAASPTLRLLHIPSVCHCKTRPGRLRGEQMSRSMRKFTWMFFPEIISTVRRSPKPLYLRYGEYLCMLPAIQIEADS